MASPIASLPAPPDADVAELRAEGRARRREAPRRSHGDWAPSPRRPDPVALLERSNRSRLPDLVPVRYARMLASPWTFLRGAPAIMASDLRRSPRSGFAVQLCGDAHLLNFGLYASPERRLVFDLNDFDETLPGPWEWDLKRLTASAVVASRVNGATEEAARDAARAAARGYRRTVGELAELSPLEIWYLALDVDQVSAEAGTVDPATAKAVAKARGNTRLKALAKLTTVDADGRRVIVDDPPLVERVTPANAQGVGSFYQRYVASLDAATRHLLGRYRFVDVARKVVGVGSVGTRCYVVLLEGRVTGDPLFLQIKEAQTSVLSAGLGRSEHGADHGQRVVTGQRLLQSASDIFLGWSRQQGRHYYVRQLRDMKGSAVLEGMDAARLARYAEVCGAVLARAHARSASPTPIAGYLGSGEAMDEALVSWAVAYADQTERDFEALGRAAATGRIPVA